MKRMIRGTSGRSTSIEYIKNQLFSYLADYENIEIDEIPLKEAIDRVQQLRPIFDIDDIFAYMEDEGVSFSAALIALEDEAENM